VHVFCFLVKMPNNNECAAAEKYIRSAHKTRLYDQFITMLLNKEIERSSLDGSENKFV